MSKNSSNKHRNSKESFEKNKMTYDELKEMFREEKEKEDKRHRAEVHRIKKESETKMMAAKKQEKEYNQKLNEMKIKYLRQKDKLEKKHENSMQIVLEASLNPRHNFSPEIDDDYIDAVSYELSKLFKRSRNGSQARERYDKLRAINIGIDEMVAKNV